MVAAERVRAIIDTSGRGGAASRLDGGRADRDGSSE